jgi:hypothetical protein
MAHRLWCQINWGMAIFYEIKTIESEVDAEFDHSTILNRN